VYTPEPDFNGGDRFVFSVNDGQTTRRAVVSIEITPVNDPPLAQDGTLRLQRDTSASGQFVAQDIDRDALTPSILEQPIKGTLELIDGNQFVYSPEPGAVGRDKIVYQVNDGNEASEPAVIYVNINAPGNVPPRQPSLISPIQNTQTGTSVTFEWTKVNDANGDALMYELILCDNEQFRGCDDDVIQVAELSANESVLLAFSGSTLGLALFGLMGGGNRRRLWNLAIVAALVVLLNACSDAANSVSQPGVTQKPSQTMSHTVSGLDSNRTYYWKVLVDDSRGGTTESVVRSFNTQ
jgi:hypothetical protein